MIKDCRLSIKASLYLKSIRGEAIWEKCQIISGTPRLELCRHTLFVSCDEQESINLFTHEN